jgi:hypothetical protein
MYGMKTVIAALALIAITGTANAQISLGQPAYGGTGCPAGSASATLTDDGSVLSILFDQFVAESGGVTGRRIDRKACNMRIPVNVGQGYQVALLAFDYRGYAAIPWGGQGVFDASYSYIGQKYPVRFSKSFGGGTQSNYTLKNELISTTVTWSPCGRQVMLEVGAAVRSIANSSNQQTMLTVDSLDVTAGLLYKVQWRRCN